MAKTSYLAQLGEALGFSVLPNATTFKNDYQQGKGVVLGLREGYLVAVGLVSAGKSTTLGVLVRYGRGTPKEAIESALKALPTFKSFTGRKTLKVSEDGLVVGWPYAIRKPTPDAVLAFVDEILSPLRGLALPFSGKCEDCSSASVSDVTLVNGIPGYHCASCQLRFAAEKERAAEEYKNRPANYMLGVPAAIAMAALAGTAWGFFVSWAEAGSDSWSPKLHIVAGFFVSGLVAWVMFKAAGKVTRVGQAIAIVLAIAGKFWGDSLFYTFDLLIGWHTNVGLNVLSWTQHDFQVFKSFLNFVLHRFWAFKLYGFDRKFVLLFDLVWALGIPWFPWGKLPKFIPNFESAGALQESSKRQTSLSYSAKANS